MLRFCFTCWASMSNVHPQWPSRHGALKIFVRCMWQLGLTPYRCCAMREWHTQRTSETNRITERAVRRVKEDTSAVLLQSVLNENWRVHSMECYTYLRNVTYWFSHGKTPIWKTLWEAIWRTDYSMWFIGWVSPFNCEGPVKNPSFWKDSLTWNFARIRCVCGENLEG